MMKKTLSVVWVVLLSAGMGNVLFSQIYNGLYSNTTGVNSNFEELGSLVENPNTEELISASSVRQSGSNFLDDVKIQVYDPQGSVVSTFRVGNPNISELVTGVELCDDEQSVIVVGELFSFTPGVTNRAFVMRVSLVNGFVFWYRQLDAFDGVVTNDRFNGVIRNRNGSSESYFCYGNTRGYDGTQAGGVNNRSKIMIAHFNVNGALLDYSLAYDDIFVGGNNGIFFPTDIAQNAKGYYVLTGSYEYNAGSQQLIDVFVMELGRDGSPQANTMSLIDISDFSGTNNRNLAPKIYCDNPNAQYFIACTTDQLFGNNGSTYLTGVLVNQSNLSVVWTNAYWDPGFESNRVSGVGKEPGVQGYIIGGMLNTNPSPNASFVLSMLEVDPLGNANDFVEYDPVIGPTGYGYYASIVGLRGIYHKGQVTTSNDERIIRTDFNGMGQNYSCYQTTPSQSDPLLASTSVVKLGIAQEPRTRLLRWRRNPVNGLAVDCAGGSIPFRTANEQIIDEAEANLYPNVITHSTSASLKFNASKDGNYVVEVYDLAGKQVYSQSYFFEKGKQQLRIYGKDLPEGAGIIRLKNDANRHIFHSRLLTL